jgi:hypothetical protein
MEMLYTNRLWGAKRGWGSYKNLLKAEAAGSSVILALSLIPSSLLIP